MNRASLMAAALLLFASSSALMAETLVQIEQPPANNTMSGIGQISGWAVSDEEVVSVEGWLDGMAMGVLPYGGSRGDVASKHPDKPGSGRSGWSMTWNYGLLAPGDHSLEIQVNTADGESLRVTRNFTTTAFDLPFMGDVGDMQLQNATIGVVDGQTLEISGAVVAGDEADLVLQWDVASQKFQIREIRYPVAQTNQLPAVDAGADRSVNTGQAVVITAIAADDDGSIEAWNWKQVSGPSVSLQGRTTDTLRFTAPAEATTLEFRVQVTDDAGGRANDRIRIHVAEPAPDRTEGETLPGFLALINAARAVGRHCGAEFYPATDPVAWHEGMAEVALSHSFDMARNGFFSHISSDGTSVRGRVAPVWGSNYVSENIAGAWSGYPSEGIVDLWLESPGHCANIMNYRMTHIGVGGAINPDLDFQYRAFWTLNLGGN